MKTQTYFKLNRLQSALQASCTTAFQSEHLPHLSLKETLKEKLRELFRNHDPNLDHIAKQAAETVVGA